MAVRAFSIEDGNTSGSTVNSTRDREYKDIDLTLTKKPTGDVYKKESLDSVKQAVKNLLLTNFSALPNSLISGAIHEVFSLILKY